MAQPIKETVQAVMQAWDEERRTGRGSPAGLLQGVLSKKELQHAAVGYFKKGVLGIGVDSSSWLYHLGLKKEALLAKLRMQNDAIKELRFYLGEADAKEKSKTRKNSRAG
jgi:predicted nucleic acid-binding Zn ribbon protein